MAIRRTDLRVPSLDGLRAVSILLVIFGHLTGTKAFPLGLNSTVGELAHAGVRVFFLISGFLITSLLTKEIEKDGSISLARFYFRRSIRIFVPFYVFLGVLWAARGLNLVELTSTSLLHAATYTMNYAASGASWCVVHTWSLAVEEQFYILWPLLMVLVGKRRAGIAAGLFCLVVPGLRVALKLATGHLGAVVPTEADAIATGCVLSLLRPSLTNIPAYGRFLRSRMFILVWLIPIAGVAFSSSQVIAFPFLQASNICIALIIDRCITFADAGLGHYLNHPFVQRIGTLSYSLYLWQQPLLDRTATGPQNMFPLNLLIAFGLALVSYHAIESPSLRFRPILERILWPGSKAMTGVSHADHHDQTPLSRASTIGGRFESRTGTDTPDTSSPAV